MLHDDGSVDLFAEPAKLDRASISTPGCGVLDPTAGPGAGGARAVRCGSTRPPRRSPSADILHLGRRRGGLGEDPCILPKARKTQAEIAGTREAHLRDGAAMVEFLAWLDRTRRGRADRDRRGQRQLEAFRRATNALRDISFDTICGAGPDGAIVHYRVTDETDRPVRPGELLLLIDSGGQYVDGTTDITRTVVVGRRDSREADRFTRVLQGHDRDLPRRAGRAG